MKEIPLTQGYVAMVDDADFEKVSAHRWFFHGDHNLPYASGDIKLPDGTRKRVLLHRFIMDPPPNMLVDHINGNPLDNRRENLRVCTQKENMANSNNRQRLFLRSHKNTDTGYRCISSVGKKYRVRMARRCWGNFDTLQEAIDAYNKAAITLYGDSAQLQTMRTQGACIPERYADKPRKSTRAKGWAKSGEKFIYTYDYDPKFTVQLRVDGRIFRVGAFDTLEQARQARDSELAKIYQKKMQTVGA